MRQALAGKLGWVVIAAGLGGCAQERAPEPTQPDEREEAPVPDLDPNAPFLGARPGRIVGVLGPVADIDVQIEDAWSFDDGSYLSVESVAWIGDRVVMTLLSITKGHELIEPGLEQSFPLMNWGESEGPQVVLLGCVGSDVGVYDEWDLPADIADVKVGEPTDDGALDVTVHGAWFVRDEWGQPTEEQREAVTTFTLVR